MTNLLTHALQLASCGLHVFSVSPTGRPWPNCAQCANEHPPGLEPSLYEECLCRRCHAHYASSRASNYLSGEDWTDGLLAVRTGAVSGVVVLDFDMHDGGGNGFESLRKMKAQDLLPATWTVHTGGGGLHLYYRHPGAGITVPNSVGRLGQGVDVRGDGGWVIAPPSQKEAARRAYSWHMERAPWEFPLAELPPLVLGQMRPKQESLPRVQLRSNEALLAQFEESLERLRWTGTGGRNAALYQAACRAGEAIVGAGLRTADAMDKLTAAAAECGLRSHESRNTINSGLRRGARDYQTAEKAVSA